ncbi:hypothetical protein Sjap_022567 [Stephania japonica]|uniref:Amino acid transporter transmembrane domain-containing protein n=1 Tax=Stephania japonica TaxID=461633 RepID=A0AAP0ERQ7_9MAGN
MASDLQKSSAMYIEKASPDSIEKGGLKEFDDDGREKRTGTLTTSSAHIITAVIGSGVLSLAWAMAQLGWVAGTVVLIIFSLITWYTSTLLADCYRTPDPVFAQPLYAFIEKWFSHKYPESGFINTEHAVRFPCCGVYNLNWFRLVWRTAFVIVVSVIAMILPFFNAILGLLGALSFWPLTVYFPVEMYIKRVKLPRFSPRWTCLQILAWTCLMVTIVGVVGSVQGVIESLKTYKPFTTTSS